MIIAIGSKNPAKVAAVNEIIEEYDIFLGAEVVTYDSNSGVSTHPTTLEETIQGAINRAKNCFRDCKYSIGIESGLMNVPQTKTGSMETCVCAIYDGKHIYLGISSAFEYPPQITKMIHEGIEASDAVARLGLTKEPKLGATERGIIGLLTKDRITRKMYTKQALYTAMIHLENPNLYGKGDSLK